MVFIFLDNLNLWISTHMDLVTLIGIPLLTLIVTHLLNRAAENRAAANRKIERKLSQELKLVEFRQSWINDLRNAFVSFHIVLHNKYDLAVDSASLAEAASRIILLMNPEDADFKELIKTHRAMVIEKEERKEAPSLIASNELGQRILKREWDRLKKDLDNVDQIK